MPNAQNAAQSFSLQYLPNDAWNTKEIMGKSYDDAIFFSWNSSCLMLAGDLGAYAKCAVCCSGIGCSFPLQYLPNEARITQEILGICWDNALNFLEFLLSHASR